MPIHRYEYKHIYFIGTATLDSHVIETLNKLGYEGWEAFNLVYDNQATHLSIWLRREIDATV